MFVYVIGGERGPVKIGVSACPEVRLKAVQTSCPYPVWILASGRGSEHDEQLAHAYFAEYRLHGEWFKRCPKLKRFAKMLDCGVSVREVLRRLAPIVMPERGVPLTLIQRDPSVIPFKRRPRRDYPDMVA